MGILKIKPSPEPSFDDFQPRREQQLAASAPAPMMADEEKDPYDVFFKPRRSPSWTQRIVQAALVIIVGAAIVGAGYSARKIWSQTGEGAIEHPFVYFEVKVIDPDGHPVAGALVEKGHERLGVTDSFGEWRRFLRAPLGSVQRFHITKEWRSGNLRAEKNFAIPPATPKHGDIEVKETVALTKADEAKEPLVLLEQRDELSDDQRQDEPADEFEVSSVATTQASKSETRTHFERVWIKEGSRDGRVASVVKAMRERVVQLGLGLDPTAPWSLTVSLLSAPGASRSEDLLLVRSAQSEIGEKASQSFLRNFKGSAMETARGILWAATLHVPIPFRVEAYGDRWIVKGLSRTPLWQPNAGQIVENDQGMLFEVEGEQGGAGLLLRQTSARPCSATTGCIVQQADLTSRPPLPGGSPLQVRLLGNLSPSLELYVAGYQARRLNGGLFSYWGDPTGAANVTVVDNGRIVHRSRLAASRTSVPRLVIPKERLSRR